MCLLFLFLRLSSKRQICWHNTFYQVQSPITLFSIKTDWPLLKLVRLHMQPVLHKLLPTKTNQLVAIRLLPFLFLITVVTMERCKGISYPMAAIKLWLIKVVRFWLRAISPIGPAIRYSIALDCKKILFLQIFSIVSYNVSDLRRESES